MLKMQYWTLEPIVVQTSIAIRNAEYRAARKDVIQGPKRIKENEYMIQ